MSPEVKVDSVRSESSGTLGRAVSRGHGATLTLDSSARPHNAPRRQYVITLTGEVEIGLGDGTTHRFGAGHVTLAEDLTGRGHTTRVVGSQARMTATIHLAD